MGRTSVQMAGHHASGGITPWIPGNVGTGNWDKKDEELKWVPGLGGLILCPLVRCATMCDAVERTYSYTLRINRRSVECINHEIAELSGLQGLSWSVIGVV